MPADFPNRDALIASLSTNAHSDTVLAEWDAFAQNAEVVNEIGNVDNLPVQLITALNTYHEQPLPSENPDETTRTWVMLQDDLLTLFTNGRQTVLEEATHFSLLVDPNHASAVSEVIRAIVEEVR